jgi:hypothetical protein
MPTVPLVWILTVWLQTHDVNTPSNIIPGVMQHQYASEGECLTAGATLKSGAWNLVAYTCSHGHSVEAPPPVATAPPAADAPPPAASPAPAAAAAKKM